MHLLNVQFVGNFYLFQNTCCFILRTLLWMVRYVILKTTHVLLERVFLLEMVCKMFLLFKFVFIPELGKNSLIFQAHFIIIRKNCMQSSGCQFKLLCQSSSQFFAPRSWQKILFGIKQKIKIFKLRELQKTFRHSQSNCWKTDIYYFYFIVYVAYYMHI